MNILLEELRVNLRFYISSQIKLLEERVTELSTAFHRADQLDRIMEYLFGKRALNPAG